MASPTQQDLANARAELEKAILDRMKTNVVGGMLGDPMKVLCETLRALNDANWVAKGHAPKHEP